MKTLTTQVLNKTELYSLAKAFVQFLSSYIDYSKQITISYGIGSHSDYEFKDEIIELSNIWKVLTDRIDEEIVDLGNSDLYLRHKDFEFHICNDSDIHLKSNDVKIREFMEKYCKEKKYEVYIN